MIIFVLVYIVKSILNKIPEQYNDLVNQAREMAKKKAQKRALSNQNTEQKILYPGRYHTDEFTYELNTIITGDGATGLDGYAIDDYEKVIAIISTIQGNDTDFNTAKNTVMSLNSHSSLLKLDEKIAYDGDVSIVRYNEVEPFSIFERFQFSSLGEHVSSFSHFYSPLKGYMGKDIYNDFGGNAYCDKTLKKGRICKGFLRCNWPDVSSGDEISEQEALQKNITVTDSETGEEKQIITNIGGVFGLFGGYQCDISQHSSLILLFVGSEAEIQLKFLIPKGTYKKQNLEIGKYRLDLFEIPLKIFAKEYRVNVSAVVSLNVKNLNCIVNNDLPFNFRAGYKTQKEFHLYSLGKKKRTQNPYSFQDLITKDLPPNDAFRSDEFEFDLSLYAGLETQIFVPKAGEKELFFALDGGIEIRRNFFMQHAPKICSSPHLLAVHHYEIYLSLECTHPLRIFFKLIPLIPAKKFFGFNPIWVSKNSNQYCLGGDFYYIDHSEIEKRKSTALFKIDTVKYTTENFDKSDAKFKITLNHYPASLKDNPHMYDFLFDFPKKIIKEGKELNLNSFSLLKDFTDLSSAKFNCIDQTKSITFSNQRTYGIGDGFNQLVPFQSKKGTVINALIKVEPAINLKFDDETPIKSLTKYASITPNLPFRDSIGLIQHKKGSLYEVTKTFIYEEYIDEAINSFTYEIKNAWRLEITNINADTEKYDSIVISFDKTNGQTTKQIYSNEFDKNSISKIKESFITFDIPSPDYVLKMNIIFKTKPKIKKNMQKTDIPISQNFFLFEENKIEIKDENDPKWNIELKFSPHQYPIIFDIENVHSEDSIICAPAFKLNVPFKQDIIEKSPSSDNVKVSLKAEENTFGIFKLDFEINGKFPEDFKSSINALLVMKKLKPLCESNKIGENTYIIKIPKDDITTQEIDGKTIATYAIPFRRLADDPDEIIPKPEETPTSPEESSLFSDESQSYSDESSSYSDETQSYSDESSSYSDDISSKDSQIESNDVEPMKFNNVNIKEPSITVVDVYLSSSEDADYCGKTQRFTDQYSFLHHACILIINEETQNYNYIATSSEQDDKIIQYSYPPEINTDIEWKLFGFRKQSDSNKPVILWQNEVQFPVDSHFHNVGLDITSYFSEDKMQYSLICPRCKSIKYVVFSDPQIEGEVNTIDNTNKFIFSIEKNLQTNFYAVCKDDDQIQCGCNLAVENNKLSLISVPLISEINGNSNIESHCDLQFLNGIDSTLYYTDTKSKISILKTFDKKLNISIISKSIGKYICIYAINNDLIIPFKNSFFSTLEKNLQTLSIEINYNGTDNCNLVGGMLYLYDIISFGSITSINPSLSYDLFGIHENQVESINANYEEHEENKNINENNFCFVQSDVSLCNDAKSIALRYPAYNSFYSFVTELKDVPIIILIENNITDFYPLLYSLEEREVIFKCTNHVKVSGEFSIPAGVKISFNGPFDLTDLKITILVDWYEQAAGIITINDDVQISVIDVDIVNNPNEYNSTFDKELTICQNSSKNIEFDLLKNQMFISNFEYFIYEIKENKIRCFFRSLIYKNQNEFCIYNTKRDLCSHFNEMDSITIANLNDFQNYFHGNYGDVITLHLVENMTFDEKTLKSFFDNYPLASFVLTSENDVYLQGIFKCPKMSFISFIENDKLHIRDLIIEKNIPILHMYQTKKNNRYRPYIELGDKRVKQIKVKAEDYPQNNIMDIGNTYLYIKDCYGLESISIESNSFETNFIRYVVTSSYDESLKSINLNIKLEILYNDPNTFCIYDSKICSIETGWPIKADQIDTIKNFINTEKQDKLILVISEKVNIDFDLSFLAAEGINSLEIKCDLPNINLAGKIKIPESFTAVISGLMISELTLDINIDILNAISSFYDISQCEGVPKIKLIPHNLPIIHNDWAETEGNDIEILITKKELDLSYELIKLPMQSGYIVPNILIKEEGANKLVYIKYSFDEIKVKPNGVDHFCLYENDDSKCTSNVVKIKSNDFCSSKFSEIIKGINATIQVVNDINLGNECNMSYFEGKDSKYSLFMYGDTKIKGSMTISNNTEITFLNSNLIDELQITISIKFPDDSTLNEISYGKINLYEGEKPKVIKVSVPKYSKDIESKEFESQQFVQGICLNMEKDIPVPLTRDFRIKTKCSNTNGIFGMKLKIFKQDYDLNHFCYYKTDITKCILNEELERFLPVKYSDTEPSFASGGDDPLLYLFEKPEKNQLLLFKSASLLGHKSATIINKDNAIVTLFVPLNFRIVTEGNFDNSEIYMEYDPIQMDYGIISITGSNIKVHPILMDHNSFVNSGNIILSNNEQQLSSILKMEEIDISRIKNSQNGIIISPYQMNYNYRIDPYSSTTMETFYNSFNYVTATLLMSKKSDLNPFKLMPLRFAIKNTQKHELTLSMQKPKASKVEDKFLFIENSLIKFDDSNNCDFDDIHVSFINCQLDKNYIDKIQGKYLSFDRQSYYSFFSSSNNNIYAFNGDEIEVTQSYIYLQQERFVINEIPVVHLSTFNTLNARSGQTINFTGTDSTLTIRYIEKNALLSFMSFNDLSIISGSFDDCLSLYNVTKCRFKLSDEKQPHYIKYIEVGENDQTEINSNGNLIVNDVLLSNNFKGNSVVKIKKLETNENHQVQIEESIFTGVILIKDESVITVKSCSSIEPITITINCKSFSYHHLVFQEINDIEISKIVVVIHKEDEKEKQYLMKGITNELCEKIKSNITINNLLFADLTDNYEIKCEDDDLNQQITFKYSLPKEKKKPKLKKIHIIIIGVVALVVVLAIIITVVVCLVIKKKKGKESGGEVDEIP